MKIISWNVNGIRAVERKGELQTLLAGEKPDILFIQETKAKPEQLSELLTQNESFHQYYHSAEKAGYSGVSAWVSKKFSATEPTLITKMPGWNDMEGRIIQVDFTQRTFIGVYFPNGGKSPEAWQEKLRFYDHFLKYINKLRKKGRKVIWCGDLNVAHNEIDLARPKENEGNIGFRPEERAWADKVIAADWVDTYRKRNPDTSSYTWWNMQTRARDRDVGWRIDYFLVDKSDIENVQNVSHLSKQMGSDHCPICLEITDN
ncbi:MAG: exodeoxyribonuclease III [Leptospirales bacterium]